ncbi:MAG: amidophosphoribosyltransferase [Lentisphaeria bacterium]|nr:amidophosphoribosyltransferase [Lentisphaeria bacterium]
MNREKPREYCGLCGISKSDSVVEHLYGGLHAQQHRGQEAAGVMLAHKGTCELHRSQGLVDDLFSNLPSGVKNTVYERGISHVRYSTAGGEGIVNAQPLMVNIQGEQVGIAHNGTICNAPSLRKRLQRDGVIFQTTTDTELVLHLIARCLTNHCGDLLNAFAEALLELKGAFCFLLMTKDCLVAARDPMGFRPLAIGDFVSGGYIVASETIAFDVTGAQFLREVEPGEMVIWGAKNQMESRRYAACERRAHCIFEHVYFARPGSYVFGDSVYTMRKAMGRTLAREAPVDADVVVPVPDSGIFAAMGYAEEIGLPVDMGFTRNHYVGRTFIDPGLVSRKQMVSRKLHPIAEAVEGKRVCLVEDSIVRGTTSRARIHTIRQAGAKEVHMRISCPPHRFGCFFGIDFPERDELVANKMNLDELCKSLRLDSLAYLSKEGMLACATAYEPGDYCAACFDGNYPVEPEFINQK